MSAPPARASLFPAGSLAPATAKTLWAAFYDYALALLGADGSTAAARNAMEVPVYNYLHNPDGAIYQRAVAATADDGYIDDRWYVLTQTASVTPSQLSFPENGYRYGLRLTQHQASSQRMGRTQIVEGFDAASLRGKTVTVGGRMRCSASQTVRYALLAWTGTEDAVTSDVVNDWTNATFTTGNFFNSTTLSLVATGSTAMSAGTAANCSVSGTVPSCTNLIFMYWTEAVAAQNVTLDGWGLRLVDATGLVEAHRRDVREELSICQRFLPGLLLASTDSVGAGSIYSSTAGLAYIQFPVPARVKPTGVSVSAGNALRFLANGSSFTSSAVVFQSAGVDGALLSATISGATAGQGAVVDAGAAARIIFTGAEL